MDQSSNPPLSDDSPRINPWTDDRLGHAGFSRRMAEALARQTAPNGYVIGLHGEWGSGKLRPIGTVSSRSWLFLSLSGLATGASWLCYFRALKVGDASRVAPVDKLSVVIVALLGVLFLGEHLSLRAWSGVALIASGAVLVALG